MRSPASTCSLLVVAASLLALAANGVQPLAAQIRSMAQDPSLDNLSLPPDLETAEPSTLGRVRKVGEGPRKMLLIPGLGFGGEIWDEFMERHKSEYTMYAITLPGFGGTPPLPMPAESAIYSTTPWFRYALTGIEHLVESEHIQSFTVVAHWALATQLALRLALDHPERVEALVIVGGALKSYYESTPEMMTWTLEQRARFNEAMAQRWFRTVSRETWDDNNFMFNSSPSRIRASS